MGGAFQCFRWKLLKKIIGRYHPAAKAVRLVIQSLDFTRPTQLSEWKSAAGTVTNSSVVKEKQRNGGNYYFPEIDYQYEIEGKTYIGSCCDDGSNNAGDAQRIADKYPAGTEIDVLVNPADAYSSRMKDSVSQMPIAAAASFGLGLFLAIIGEVWRRSEISGSGRAGEQKN